MLPVEILKKKRDGLELSKKEIIFFIQGIISSYISDVQAAAFLTSSYINGLTAKEIAYLTFAMRDSGEIFEFPDINKPIIDKHSTGGVGDKISLLLVPILMSCDIAVPMISGKGLGHTGGTVDKLESVVGYNMHLPKEKLKELLYQNGAFMTAQTDEIAPADKILYDIRDITGNVDSNGLIAASILCKKLAEGLDGLVLDMKVGNGAFMRNFTDAKLLADTMAAVARESGLKMQIIFSAMEQPLGYTVGNWLEIEETIQALEGNFSDDIRELTLTLAAAMIQLGYNNLSRDEALDQAKEVWDSGLALKNFNKMISAQGGDIESSQKKYQNTPNQEIKAKQNGFIAQIDTLYVGVAGIILGAGRRNTDDIIDHSAGIRIFKKTGDNVKKGETIAIVYGQDKYRFGDAIDLLQNCFVISEKDVATHHKLIIDELKIK